MGFCKGFIGSHRGLRGAFRDFLGVSLIWGPYTQDCSILGSRLAPH